LLLPEPVLNFDTRSVARWTVLSDLSYIEIRSREPQFLDSFYYHELSLEHTWSSAPILERIGKEHYDLILLSGEEAPPEFHVKQYRGISFWGPEILEEARLHYRPLCETPNQIALVPLDRLSPVHETDLETLLQQPCQPASRWPQMPSMTR